MMRCIAFLLGLISITSLNAQQVITLLKQGQPTQFFYDANNITAVITAAAHGDTIVLPGGPITPSGSLSINKRLVWVGAGYRPDTTIVTTPTVFTDHPLNQIFIQQNASGSRFHGIRFERLLQIGEGTPNQVSDIGITRCEFHKGLRLSAGQGYSSSNVQVRQCVLRQGIHVPSGINSPINAPQGFLAENCIIVGSIDFGSHMTTGNVTNCILLSSDLSSLFLNNGLSYTNCVFASIGNSMPINNPSYFQHCLIAQSGGTNVSWGATAQNVVGNISSVLNPTNVFRNVPVWNAFDYNYDYRLAPASPAANMGGTQSGVYGGPPGAAWKQGGIPFNPHWISLSPSLGISTGGVVNVDLSGAAQPD